MRLVAESFAWPFRGRWRASWSVGVPVVLLSWVLFIPLLGYAVEATGAAEKDPSLGPPPWRPGRRLIADGALLLLATWPMWLPLLFFEPLVNALRQGHVWDSSDPALASVHAIVLTFFILALPSGLLGLLLLPHAVARYAASRRRRDLFDVIAVLRAVRRDFPTWNVVVAAIVTGWAIGLACVGLFCVGLVPGIYYAILVSAHAAATLKPKDSNPSPR